MGLIRKIFKTYSHNLKSQFGLLSPKGVWYSCDYGEHYSLAIDLGANFERGGLKEGWVHADGTYWYLERGNEPTQDQIDTAFDWSQAVEGRTVPNIVRI